MKKHSAGLMLYRLKNGVVEVMLVHPGGPFWAKKDKNAWSIPKGEFDGEEDPLTAAKREFAEELGGPSPEGQYMSLGETKQSSGKIVHAWTMQADFPTGEVRSNTFTLEWPPKSGQEEVFPEIDKAAWFSLASAQMKLVKGQIPFLERLATHLQATLPETPTQATLF